MKHIYILLLATCLATSLSATAQHKTVVYGNLGVDNVNISIVNTPYGTSTDAKGNYELPLFDLLFSALGHPTFSFSSGM